MNFFTVEKVIIMMIIVYNDFSNFNTFQLPVQVKKNPGLGFSIAGGVAGAETVRKIYILFA